jgi:hypothetical protein
VKYAAVAKFFAVVLLSLSWAAAAQSMPAKVAIIIDDIGYQKADPQLIKLPYALTFAVMPFTPQGSQMAALAASRQKEVMLHMPMEAVAQNHLLGKGALRQPMTQQQVRTALQQALAQVPQAVGINNHMGSLYTSLAEPMDWTMQLVAEHQLYFIDSKTTSRSAVPAAAARHGIASRSRDIFLDNNKAYAAIDQQFNQLMSLAKRQGSAIAIGHPYPETYAYLKKNLPRLAAEGIELVPASHLLALTPAPQPAATVAAHSKAAASDKIIANQQPAVATPASAVATPDNSKDQAKQNSLPQPQRLDPVVEVPVMELQRWHPPYLADLPGQLIPQSEAAPERRTLSFSWLSESLPAVDP